MNIRTEPMVAWLQECADIAALRAEDCIHYGATPLPQHVAMLNDSIDRAAELCFYTTQWGYALDRRRV